MPRSKIRTPEQKAKDREYGRKHYAANKVKIAQKRKERRKRPDFKAIQQERNRRPSAKASRIKYNRDKWSPKNKDKIRGYHLKAWQKQEAEFAAIAGRPRPDECDVCGGNVKGIVFDHCHDHGHFRGWLCWRCNIVLGHVQHDPILLELLAVYLREPPPNTPPPQGTLPGI